MANRIGLLLPRSTDYPTLGFDMLEGLRCNLNQAGIKDTQFITENIGYGENHGLNYEKAEKLILQEQADAVLAYCSISNAEKLYPLADATQRLFLFADAGMQLSESAPAAYAYHISLQGIHACRLAGFLAGEKSRKVLMAVSYYDGGYKGPWECFRGLLEAGGSVCGNYISDYKEKEFNITAYMLLLRDSGAEAVTACFSSYLAGLFMKALKEGQPGAVILPFYCSPFMAEEQLLSKCPFPGGTFYTVVPWASTLENHSQQEFIQAIRLTSKKAPIFFTCLAGKPA